MPKYSIQSSTKLETCHPDLIDIFEEAIQIVDVRITCGHRGQTDQMIVYHNGKSKEKWPFSYHNKVPSLAVDAVPYPVDWDDLKRFFHLAGVVKGIAHERGIKIEWGGDWRYFKDYSHYQLMEV